MNEMKHVAAYLLVRKNDDFVCVVEVVVHF